MISLLLLLFSFSACDSLSVLFSKPQLQAEVITLDSLQVKPEDSTRLAKLGVTLTRLNDSQYLLTQPAKRAGKTKYKNSFNDNSKDKSKIKDSQNTDSNNKKSGNSESFNNNKKQGQQQDVGNTDNRKEGQSKSKGAGLDWLMWLIPIAIGLYIYWPDLRSMLRKLLSAARGVL